jgi:uncharacterized YccA/Bax inhibitor family protein
MAMFNSSNPALGEKALQERGVVGEASMSTNGAINKTFALMAVLLLVGSFSWNFIAANPELTSIFTIGGAIAGLVTAMIIIFKKTAAPYLAPVYAGFQGLFLGAISVMLESVFPGIVTQAILLTVGVLLIMLSAYKTGLIKVTEKFKLGLVAATGSIFLIYMISFILGFFGIQIPYIHGNGTIGIAFSAIVVGIAALNLVLDFDFFEKGEQMQLPKYMEWYAAFGLMVTLVWLYLEILRLLSKLRSR